MWYTQCQQHQPLHFGDGLSQTGAVDGGERLAPRHRVMRFLQHSLNVKKSVPWRLLGVESCFSHWLVD